MHKESKFDPFTETYKDIINKSARLSGENYEYFARLRLELMQKELISRTGENDRFSILDFGCGIGETTRIMREMFPNSTITGYDESGESIAKALTLCLPQTTFVKAVKKGIPAKDEQYNVIYSNGTFHHIDWKDHRHFLKELARVVTLGGYVFIFENNPRNPLMMHAMKKNPFDAGLKAIPPSHLVALGKAVGLSYVKTDYYFFFPRILKLFRLLEKFLRGIPLGAQYYTLFKKTNDSNLHHSL